MKKNAKKAAKNRNNLKIAAGTKAGPKVDKQAEAATPPAPAPVAPVVRKQLLIESDGVSIKATNINDAFSMIELETVFSDLLRQVTAIRQNAMAAPVAPVEPTEPGK